MPISNDSRAPISVRLSTSRPNSSVPNQCAADGGFRRFSRAHLVEPIRGDPGRERCQNQQDQDDHAPHHQLARQARRAALAGRGLQARSLSMDGAAIADLRVEIGVEDIGHQIGRSNR